MRRHQLVTTYGVGSVIALGDESFMVAGIDHWTRRRPDDPRTAARAANSESRLRRSPGQRRRPDSPTYPWSDSHCMHSCPAVGDWRRTYEFTTYDDNRCGGATNSSFPRGSWLLARTVTSMTSRTSGGCTQARPRRRSHELRLEHHRHHGFAARCSRVVHMREGDDLGGCFPPVALCAAIARCTGKSPWLRSRPDRLRT